MGNNFLYLKVNTEEAFNTSINPQIGNAVVYLAKVNNNFVWMAKDENGNYYKLGSIASENNSNADIAQVTNVNENGTVTVNTLGYKDGKPYLTKSTNEVNVYNFVGVPINIQATLPNNDVVTFYLQDIYAVGNNRIWNSENKKLYYNIAYERWNIENLTNQTLIDYTVDTQSEPYDSKWANGSELIKK